MSIGSVIVTPTPTAAPLIAPMTGLSDLAILSATVPPPSRGTPSTSSAGSRCANRERAPAPAEIGPGAEDPARAGDHHHPHLVVGVGQLECVNQLFPHRKGERVEPLRAVQCDGAM